MIGLHVFNIRMQGYEYSLMDNSGENMMKNWVSTIQTWEDASFYESFVLIK